MNIILVSSRWAKSRSLYLGGKQFIIIMLLMFGLMVSMAIAMQYTLIRLVPDSLATVLRDGVQPQGRQNQLAYQRSSMDAMAVKLGEMQARLQRLDALGGRLVTLTGMKPSEFQFEQIPAQGGPLLSAEPLSAASLQHQLDKLAHLIDDRTDKLMALETLLRQNQLSQEMLPSSAPINVGWYTSNFGWRTDPITGKSAMHEGVDYMAEAGTPIKASAGGIVVYADTHSQYGNMIEIDHGNDIVTRYAHASRLLVKVGQVVRRGDKIAEVGSTGRSTGNHLHFEVRYKGSAQNPVRFLQNAAG